MSKLSKSSTSTKYITRRIRDAEGNIIVKRYKKRENAIPIKIPWERTPSIISGSISGAYAYLINQYNSGSLGSSLFFPEVSQQINTFFSSLEGIASLFLTGSIAVGLGTFLGWSLITQGFKIKKWGGAARQLLAIGAMLLFTTAVFSSFINEAGVIRHQDDTIDVNENYDLENLDSPFYSELLNGLLDLLGPLPDPSLLIATVKSLDGQELSKEDDTYLWRYRVADTYDPETRDYTNNFDQYLTDFSSAAPLVGSYPAGSKGFRVSQQYLNPTAGFTDGLLTPWNSIYDSQVDISTPEIEANNLDAGDIVEFSSIDMQKDINSRNVIQAALTKSRTSGYFDFDAYYIPEQQENIAQNSISYGDFLNAMLIDGYKSDLVNTRNNAIEEAGTLSSIWGSSSLPDYYDLTQNITEFGDASVYNGKILSYQANLDQSVYGLILQVHNQIQNAVLDLLTNPSAAETFSSTSENSGNNEAPPGEDRAFYFWRQIENQQLFGIKDFLVGYVNMLRSLNIPSRLVIGFNSGTIDENTDTISIYAGDVSPWIEALIPWTDQNGTLQYSWGAFNPLPKLSLLLNEGRFVYGQNSLGGQPTIELDSTSGVETNLGGDIGSFSLAEMNKPFNFGSRVLFEEIPAPNQKIELKILNEDELLSLAAGNVADILNAGTDLGTITTDGDGENWANLSITVSTDKSAILTVDGVDTNLEGEYPAINPFAAEGERNLFAIVARYALEVDFIVVGWQLEASISLAHTDTDVDTVEINDTLGVFDGIDQLNTSFSYSGEELGYRVQVNDLDGLPISEVELQILWLSPTDLENIELTLLSGDTEALKADIGDDTPITGLDGSYSFNFITPTKDGDQTYYSLMAWIPNTAYYATLYIKLSEDFKLTYEIVDYGDFLINLTETIDWTVNFTALFTDNILNLALFPNSVVDRVPEELELDYYLITRDAFDLAPAPPLFGPATDRDNYFLNEISNCATDYSEIDVNCYKLSETDNTMGVLSGTTVSEGQGRIAMVGGAIALGSYYLVLELVIPGQDNTYYINDSQRFVFAPFELSSANRNFNLPIIDFENSKSIEAPKDQIIEFKETTVSEYTISYLFNSIFGVVLIPIIVHRKQKLVNGGIAR
jgi:hypothetical protein